jgi:phosphatidylglycerol:prolipoprotein diacylglycerol transferase
MSDTYPWFFSLGALASLLWLGWVDLVSKRSEEPLPLIARIDAGISALVAGLLGARLGYVCIHLPYYTHYPAEILMIWNGGLTWMGGAIGAILGLIFYAAISRHSFWQMADTLAMPAVLFSFTLWFGCMLDGCAYGKPSNVEFITPVLQDIFGTRMHRWPVQSAGAVFSLGTLLILDRVRQQKITEGSLASIGLGLISAGNFLLAFFRGDTVPVLFGFRSDAIGSAALCVLCVLSLAYCIRKAKN